MLGKLLVHQCKAFYLSTQLEHTALLVISCPLSQPLRRGDCLLEQVHSFEGWGSTLAGGSRRAAAIWFWPQSLLCIDKCKSAAGNSQCLSGVFCSIWSSGVCSFRFCPCFVFVADQPCFSWRTLALLLPGFLPAAKNGEAKLETWNFGIQPGASSSLPRGCQKNTTCRAGQVQFRDTTSST